MCQKERRIFYRDHIVYLMKCDLIIDLDSTNLTYIELFSILRMILSAITLVSYLVWITVLLQI